MPCSVGFSSYKTKTFHSSPLAKAHALVCRGLNCFYSATFFFFFTVSPTSSKLCIFASTAVALGAFVMFELLTVVRGI